MHTIGTPAWTSVRSCCHQGMSSLSAPEPSRWSRAASSAASASVWVPFLQCELTPVCAQSAESNRSASRLQTILRFTYPVTASLPPWKLLRNPNQRCVLSSSSFSHSGAYFRWSFWYSFFTCAAIDHL